MDALKQLIKQAAALADNDICTGIGHEWKSDGGRECPKGGVHCSQTVYVCERCGIHDYGDPGGPAHTECFSDCKWEGFENDD